MQVSFKNILSSKSDNFFSSQVRTMITPSIIRCGDIPSVPNAYILNVLWANSDNNAYPMHVLFKCNSGYKHVSASGALSVSCVNDVWSTLSACTRMVLSI